MFSFKVGFIEVTWIDVIDIGMVGYLLFQLYKLMRGSVAIKILFGSIVLYAAYLLVKVSGMELMTSILGQFMSVGVIALLILFQQEIRRFLLLLGKATVFDEDNPLRGFVWRRSKKGNEKHFQFSPVIEAAKSMAASHTGALIVFAKNSDLKFYTESGDLIDAIISKRLLISIFNKYSPMHDGAVIINKNRIKAARCILPVSDRSDIPANFGLRHRAAIGLTETTDAIVLVVSEETGQFSIIHNGILDHNLSTQELRNKLNYYLIDDNLNFSDNKILNEVKEIVKDLRNKGEELREPV